MSYHRLSMCETGTWEQVRRCSWRRKGELMEQKEEDKEDAGSDGGREAWALL